MANRREQRATNCPTCGIALRARIKHWVQMSGREPYPIYKIPSSPGAAEKATAQPWITIKCLDLAEALMREVCPITSWTCEQDRLEQWAKRKDKIAWIASHYVSAGVVATVETPPACPMCGSRERNRRNDKFTTTDPVLHRGEWHTCNHDWHAAGETLQPASEPMEEELLDRDSHYEGWREGYGEPYVRPKDAWDAGWAARSRRKTEGK